MISKRGRTKFFKTKTMFAQFLQHFTAVLPLEPHEW